MSNYTYTITITGKAFDTKMAECAHIKRVLELAIMELGRGQGQTTSGNIIGVDPNGTANTSLGSWSFSSGNSSKG